MILKKLRKSLARINHPSKQADKKAKVVLESKKLENSQMLEIMKFLKKVFNKIKRIYYNWNLKIRVKDNIMSRIQIING